MLLERKATQRRGILCGSKTVDQIVNDSVLRDRIIAKAMEENTGLREAGKMEYTIKELKAKMLKEAKWSKVRSSSFPTCLHYDCWLL